MILAHLLAAVLALPATPKKPAVQRYHGVKVSDDYRWLENDKDAKVQQWSEAQNAAARAFLDDIPWRDSLRKRIDALVASEPDTRTDASSGEIVVAYLTRRRLITSARAIEISRNAANTTTCLGSLRTPAGRCPRS